MTSSPLSNLGVIAEYRGDFVASRTSHERALAPLSEIRDHQAISVTMKNVDMIAFLQKRHEEARE